MRLDFPTKRIKEGAAFLLVPKLELAKGEPFDRAISKAPVFYNPRMRLNRDIAVLALGVYQRRLSRQLANCEPMCGTGVRGIRLALEVPDVDEVVMGDLNPSAVRLAEENAAINQVSDRVRIRLMEANLLLSLHDRPWRRFDYIDLDPYGSPVPYLDATIRACRNGGMIALTATDMAPLCGVNPKACLRKYGGLPLRTEYCHEVALRLIAGTAVKTAAVHEVAAQPVFGYAVDHYVRLYMLLVRGARKADHCLDRMGYFLHCRKCSNRLSASTRELRQLGGCDVCGSRMEVGGPMWLGELSERDFCDEMLSLANRSFLSSDRRLMNLIRLVSDEVGFKPGFYNIDALCSKLRIASLSTRDVLSALEEAGFDAVRTHFDERGVKTDASIVELENVLKGFSKRAGRGD